MRKLFFRYRNNTTLHMALHQNTLSTQRLLDLCKKMEKLKVGFKVLSFYFSWVVSHNCYYTRTTKLFSYLVKRHEIWGLTEDLYSYSYSSYIFLYLNLIMKSMRLHHNRLSVGCILWDEKGSNLCLPKRKPLGRWGSDIV